MAKRGMNIYKRRDGRWEGRYKCGYTAEGKSKYRSVYAKSYSDVRMLLEQKKSERNRELPSCKFTVCDLVGLWLENIKNKVKESTFANYNLKLEKHIIPYFGGLKYEQLTAHMLNKFIQEKLSAGLSEKYVSDIVILIKSVAKFGGKMYGYSDRIEYVTLPKADKAVEKPLLSAAEQTKLQKYLMHERSLFNTGVLLAMTTGIRIGELCALKWSDIDLKKSVLTVSKTVQRIKNTTGKGTKLIITAPKSRTSVRRIPLPDFLIPILSNICADENAYILSGSDKLVEPRTMQYRFKSLLKKLKLPNVSFHSLRHAFATKCIALGFDVKTLSEILGHSSVEITLNRYVHSSMERKQSFMKLLSDSIGAA